MDSAEAYVIVGGSAAGMAAAQAIRERDPAAGITVLSEEADAPYFRPLIPYLVSGRKQAREMTLAGSGPYTGRNIQVWTEARVTAVDCKGQRVTLADGRQLGYGKVLFATGSRPFLPPEIKGTDTEGVFALRTLADARRMAKRADTTRRAVMLGGGLLNLKAAFALLERGIRVTLVVFSPEVLSQLMDPSDALLIRHALDRAGLEIRTGTAARQIVGDESGVCAVGLDNGDEIACQMVCIGKGVRPNVDFLAGSGIRISEGIVADRFTACNQPNTFAAGDVAVTHEPVSGRPIMTALWTNAVEMGRCAGFNMAGLPTAYTGTFGILNATQVADMPFVAMGTVHTEGLDLEIHRHASAEAYRKLVFDTDGKHLVGAVLVGNITNAGIYRYLIREKRDITTVKRQIVNHRLHYGHLLPI
jgi:NAD(P)H-nitrite reductase large subunit